VREHEIRWMREHGNWWSAAAPSITNVACRRATLMDVAIYRGGPDAEQRHW